MSDTTVYMRSSEVASLLGVTKRTLFNWLKAGKIPEPKRNGMNGYRLWRPEDVQMIRMLIEERRDDKNRNQ